MNARLALPILAAMLMASCSSTPESPFMEGPPSPAAASSAGAIAAPGSASTYTVVAGDSLWSIAKRTYGKGSFYQRILAANPGLDPRNLQVGQRIRLPEIDR